MELNDENISTPFKKRKKIMHLTSWTRKQAILALLPLVFSLFPNFELLGIFSSILILFLFDVFQKQKFLIPSLLLIPVTSAAFSWLLHIFLNLTASWNIRASYLIAYCGLLIVNNSVLSAELTFPRVLINRSAAVLAFPSLLGLFLYASDPLNFLTRFAEGDSRNHALLIENITQNGFVTSAQQGFYPSGFLFVNAIGANIDHNPSVFYNALIGIAFGFLVCTLVIISALLRLSELLNLRHYQTALLSTTVVYPPIVGFIFLNGFWSAYWAFALIIFINVLLISACKDNFSKQLHLQLFTLCLLGYHAWAFITPSLFIMSLLYLNKNRIIRFKVVQLLPISFLVIYTLFSIVDFDPAGRSILELVKLDGGIQDLNFTVVCLLFGALYWLSISIKNFSQFYVSQVSIAIILYLAIGLARLPGEFDGYYNRKLIWILLFGLMPIFLALFFKMINDLALNRASVFTGLISWCLIANLSGIPLVSSAAFAIGQTGLSGSQAVALRDIKGTDVAIFWYFENPPTDRLASFWSSFPSNPVGNSINFNTLAVWAYNQTGRAEDLCNVISSVQDLTIYTKFPNTISEVVQLNCPSLMGKYSVKTS